MPCWVRQPDAAGRLGGPPGPGAAD